MTSYVFPYFTQGKKLLGVAYGWCIVGPYAHVLDGSIAVKTFYGPWCLQRALVHIRSEELT